MVDPNTVVTSALVATTVASVVKGAKAPAQFIDDIMQLVGFGKFNELANKSRLKQQQREEEYKIEIAHKVDAIPEEFQQVPELSIIGPAIEASKFYIEEKELRSMFSNIISASIDSRKDGKVHQSFVEIVKQMSTLDAKHMSQINSQNFNPVVKIKLYNKENKKEGFQTAIELIYISDFSDQLDNDLINSSLKNLERLGLIDINLGTYYTDERVYSEIQQSHLVDDIKTKYELIKEIDVEKGLIEITSFGKLFCEICL